MLRDRCDTQRRGGLLPRILLLASLFAATASASEPPGWYVSNRDFMILEPVSGRVPDLADSRGYLLRITDGEDLPQTQLQELFLDGEPAGTRRERFGTTGPIELQEFDPDGEIRFTERYRYRPDGSLRSVIRCPSDVDCIDLRYGEQPGGESTETLLKGTEPLLALYYDGAARLVRRVSADDISTEYTYAGDELIRETITSPARIETLQYRDALVLHRSVTESGRLIEDETRTYDSQDRLVSRTVVFRRSTTEERYRYDPDGSTEREEYRDGILARSVVTAAGGSEVETTYADGRAILIVYRRDGVRYREETLRDGTVIRTRSFDLDSSEAAGE